MINDRHGEHEPLPRRYQRHLPAALGGPSTIAAIMVESIPGSAGVLHLGCQRRACHYTYILLLSCFFKSSGLFVGGFVGLSAVYTCLARVAAICLPSSRGQPKACQNV